MNNEWLVIKHNYNEECPNIDSGGFTNERSRLFKSARKFLTYHNNFDGGYFPWSGGFFWPSHELERIFMRDHDTE